MDFTIFTNWQTVLLCLTIYLTTQLIRSLIENAPVAKRFVAGWAWQPVILPFIPAATGILFALFCRQFPWPLPVSNVRSAQAMYGATCGIASAFMYARFREWFGIAANALPPKMSLVRKFARPLSIEGPAPEAPAPAPPGLILSPPVPTFWGTLWTDVKAIVRWIGMRLMAPGMAVLAVVLVVAGAVLLFSLGAKELQIGGILQKLLGLIRGTGSPAQQVIAVANSVPDNRVDPNGKIIPQGTPDAKGDTQAVVVPIQDTGGLFSNPSSVTITPPGATTPVVIQLPSGVQAKDVDKVVVIQSGQFVVTVKDTSGIAATTIDAILKRYGG